MKYPQYIKVVSVPSEPIGKVIDISVGDGPQLATEFNAIKAWLKVEFPFPVRIGSTTNTEWRMGWPWHEHAEATEAEYLIFAVLNS